MKNLKDYEKHICKNIDNPNRMEHISYCGENLYMTWCLMDIEHAEWCIEKNMRIQPCPKCLEIARKLKK